MRAQAKKGAERGSAALGIHDTIGLVTGDSNPETRRTDRDRAGDDPNTRRARINLPGRDPAGEEVQGSQEDHGEPFEEGSRERFLSDRQREASRPERGTSRVAEEERRSGEGLHD